ncbi:response regulator [Schauerella aestuarii]|uniref:response regulator n=1 Tax=Schauerella aestuarii TaxID=2511204 RepID=UPI00136BEDC6|nr:response regulator transcription factor [Achromobacter aestuarii]MYZ43563.1 response regulator transcription factor [Achromobacter aestuarii]
MKTTVLIADDHAIVREGIRSLLETTDDFEVVGEASDGQQAVTQTLARAPAMIILDLMMPGSSGASVIATLTQQCPGSRIVVLSSTEDDDLAFSAIEAGAHSFLVKTMLGDELIDTLRRVARGEAVIHPKIARRVLTVVRRVNTPQVDPFEPLSDRERAVLQELAKGRSNNRIAETLHISEKTVKTHVSSVLAKLQLGDRTEAVAFAWREGLMAADGKSD